MTVDQLLERSPWGWVLYLIEKRFRPVKHVTPMPLTNADKLEAEHKDVVKRFGSNNNGWSDINAVFIILAHVWVVKWLATYLISSLLMFFFFASPSVESHWIVQTIGYVSGLIALCLAFKAYLFEMIFYGGSSSGLHVLESWFANSEHYSFDFQDTPDRGFREYTRFGTKQIWWKRRDKWKASIELKEVKLPEGKNGKVEYYTKDDQIVTVRTKFYYRPLVGYGRGSRYFMIPESVRENFIMDIMYDFLTDEIGKLTLVEFREQIGVLTSPININFINLFKTNAYLSRAEKMLNLSVEDPSIVDFELPKKQEDAMVQQAISEKVTAKAKQLAVELNITPDEALKHAEVAFGLRQAILHDYTFRGDPAVAAFFRPIIPQEASGSQGDGGGKRKGKKNRHNNNQPTT